VHLDFEIWFRVPPQIIFVLQHLASRLWPHECSIFGAALLKISLHHLMLVLLLIYYVGLLLITLESFPRFSFT